MNSTGKAACILPHGVLFRGNAEAVIRRNLVKSGILKGIVGLPANLFYGTGIPACILVLDKENAETRRGIFMIDASQGFQKDGSKNRLRERDIHRIVSTFNAAEDAPRYARMVPFAEIADARNDYNLNLPRYVDTSEPEDLHDLEAHLRGGIPERDLDELEEYWQVLPGVRDALFEPLRSAYAQLKLPLPDVRAAILKHPEFLEFNDRVNERFNDWRQEADAAIAAYTQGSHPKEFIWDLAEALLKSFTATPLVDTYAIYQQLMDYWEETLQDDAWLIAAEGWVAEPERILVKDKRGKTRDRGWTCDLLPKHCIVARYFSEEQAALKAAEAELAGVSAEKAELEEEHGAEDAAFGDFERITAAAVRSRIGEIRGDPDSRDELAVLKQWQELTKQEGALKRAVKKQDEALDTLAFGKYAELGEGDVRSIVVEDKWLTELASAVQRELERVAQGLTGRIRELAERYEEPLPDLVAEVERLSVKVEGHLERMGMSSNVRRKPQHSGSRDDSASLRRKLLTGHTRLPDFEDQWTQKRLGDICHITTGTKDVNEGNPAGEFPFFTCSRSHTFSDSYSFNDEAILIAGNGDVGNLHYYKGKFEAYQRTYVLRGFTIDVSYLWQQLQANLANSLGLGKIGSSIPYIKREHLTNFEVSSPRSREEQSAIATVLSDMDAQIAALETLHAKMAAIKQGMMQELLTGRTRLV